MSLMAVGILGFPFLFAVFVFLFSWVVVETMEETIKVGVHCQSPVCKPNSQPQSFSAVLAILEHFFLPFGPVLLHQ